jgi:acetyl esterase
MKCQRGPLCQSRYDEKLSFIQSFFSVTQTATQKLTPAMRKIIDAMARAGHPPMYSLTPQAARAAYEAGAGVLELPAPALSRVQRLSIPTRDGFAMPAQLFAPVAADSGPALPLLLYLHGGGFTIGSVATHAVLCKRLAQLAGCAVLSVDYRLAPEHRFPQAVHDAWDALQWAAANARSLGLDVSRLAVGGDSAGGTLAIACARLARDAGLPLAAQLLFYPGCSAHQDTPSHSEYAQGFVLEKPHIDWFFSNYLRTQEDREDWRFAPLQADDWEGVAPLWLGLAECDPLHDEGLMYADKLRAAGVATELEIYRGVTHEFIKMGRALPEAGLAHQQAAEALKRYLFDS